MRELLKKMAEEFPDNIAMQVKRGEDYVRYSYGQVERMARGIGSALIQEGINPGTRIALLSENRPEWGISYLGILLSGATCVPLDVQCDEGELLTLLQDSESEVIFASDRFIPTLLRFQEEFPLCPKIVSLDGTEVSDRGLSFETMSKTPAPGGEDTLWPKASSDQIASLLYTSSTTGRPKGVLLTYGNLISNATSITLSGICTAPDNVLSLLPLHHAYPFMITFLVPLSVGARITYLNTLKAPELLRCMQETAVTIVVGVPQLFSLLHKGIFDEINRLPLPARMLVTLLLRTSGFARERLHLHVGTLLFTRIHRRFGGSVRFFVSGGAKLDKTIAADFERLGLPILEGYGLTETSPVVTFNPPQARKIGSVGLPLPGVEVKIVSPDESGVGEIAIRGPNVMKGYYKNQEETAHALREDWFFSGDLGYVDADGYLYIEGRSKEVIVLPTGKKIYPEEIENYYLKSQYIKEICIVGITDPTGRNTGEALHAVIVPHLDYFRSKKVSNIKEMIRWEIGTLSRETPPFKRITGYTIATDPLPRTHLGKIKRYLVQQTALEALSHDVGPPIGRPPPPTEDGQKLLGEITARKVLACLKEASPNKKDIGLDDNLELDLGLDSLRRIELLVALEEACDTPLPDSLGSEVFTVRELILTVREHTRGKAGKGLDGGVEGTRPSWKEFLTTGPPSPLPPGSHVLSFLSHKILRLLLALFCRMKVKGLQSLPPSGPYILAANHNSLIDGFVLFSALPFHKAYDLFFLGLEEYFNGPLTSRFARHAHVIPANMEVSPVAALQKAASVLKAGRPLCLFPEGARSVDGRIQEFKKGVGILAKELALPLVPAYIRGSYEVLPIGAKIPHPYRVEVIFGEPLSVERAIREGEKRGASDEYQAIALALQESVRGLADNPPAQ